MAAGSAQVGEVFRRWASSPSCRPVGATPAMDCRRRSVGWRSNRGGGGRRTWIWIPARREYAAELGKERARRRGDGRSDRRGDDTGVCVTVGGGKGEEGRRRAINAPNYNPMRGTEGRFACLPWTITEFRNGIRNRIR